MKVKIIDLIVKVANHDKLPKKVKYGDVIYLLNVMKTNYVQKECPNRILFDRDLFAFCNLDDYVEVIEENKQIDFEKIEELTCGVYDFERQTINSLIKNQKKLIDEINKLKEKNIYEKD